MAEPVELMEAKALVAATPGLPAITSEEDFAEVGRYVADVKRRWKQVEDYRTRITKPLDDAKRNAQAMFKPVLDELAKRETEAKRAMVTYRQAVDAEAQRARLAQTEAIRQAQEKARAAAAEEDEWADLTGETHEPDAGAEATAVLIAAASVPVPTRPEAAGFSTRKTYQVEVTNMAAFVAWCVQSGAYYLLEPNLKALRQNASAYGKAGEMAPGVVVTVEETAAMRT